jgi:hypothetical protein
MKRKLILLTLAALAVTANWVIAEDNPVVFGYGVGLFKVGSLLTQDNFENLNNWEVQIQQRSGFPSANVVVRANSLDCLVPGRGCTVWFKQKLQTRVMITYDVLCPTQKPAIKGVQPRDINNFWMANDPVDPNRGLFDPARYTGKFGSYDKMHGYYASTGGGGATANLTTRMRRYPREVDGRPAEHLALNDKDRQRDYLITPDKVMTVQLVAYDDVIQYIVNGRLNYQIARGDQIQVEGRDGEGKPAMRKAVYDLDRFPVYRDGYFGFRMVGTHHIYRNFRVYALEPGDGAEPGSPRIKPVSLVGVHASETGWGVHIKGTDGVIIKECEFTKNGAKGKEGYAHNLYLRRCKNALVSNTTLNGSTSGNGCNISYSRNVTIDSCEVLRNYFRGIRAADTDGCTVKNSVIGANGKVGLLANREKVATKNIVFINNIVFDNGAGGIQAKNGVTGRVTGCASFNNKTFNFDLNSNIDQSGNSTTAVNHLRETKQ